MRLAMRTARMTDAVTETTDRFYKSILDSLHDGVYFVDRDRRITYWNTGAERITGFKAAEVVGRFCHDNILNHVDDEGKQLCLEGCPLSATMDDGEPRSQAVYLHHKNGHRVPVIVRTAVMRDAAGGITGAVETFSENTPTLAAVERIRELETVAFVDPLTEIPNRRFTEIKLQSRFDEMTRYGWPFGIMLIDIDRFKEVNDEYGHQTGDQVLRAVARTLVMNSRSFDVVGRWGGDEFIVIAVNTDRLQLGSVAERVRALIAQSRVSDDGNVIRFTVSIGAGVATPEDTPESLLRRVDGLLYHSKQCGRNRVSL